MDGFLKQIQKGVEQVVSSGQKELAELQVKNAMSALRDERTTRLAALGSKVFALRGQESVRLVDLQAEIATIDEIDGQLAQKQKELEALRPPGQGHRAP